MKKRFIVCGIVFVFLIVFLTGCSQAKTDDKWNYSQEIVVVENSGKNLTDYPVSISLNSSNFNFSKAQSDGSDIRFFSGSKKLNYWIETWDPKNKEAIIWVKVPSLPANETNAILMKYGNPEAIDASSGKNTFDFFDGFDDGTLSELKWNIKSAGGGTVKVEDGKCRVSAPEAHAYDSSVIYSKDDFDINSMFVIKRMKVTTGTDSRGPLLRQGFIDRIDSRKNEVIHETELADESRVIWETISRKERYNSRDLTDVSVPEGEWYISGVAWFEENDTREIAWFKNGVRDSSMDYASNDFVTDLPMHIYLYAASDTDASKNTGYMAVDYALVRKFVEMEPTVSVVSTKVDSDVSAENISENSSEDENSSKDVSENTSELIPENAENVSDPVISTGSEPNSEVSASGEVAQMQENQSKEATNTQNTSFPEYNVDISGIKLSSPYQFYFPALVKELDSSGINAIFLNVSGEDVWQYERFVKMAHEKGIAVHAVLLEDLNCTGDAGLSTCQESLNSVLDYNEKSLAPFNGINIYVNPSVEEGSNNNSVEYRTLFETAHEKAGDNVSISASISSQYAASQLEEIAPLVNFFIIRAYSEETEELNSAPNIVDAIAPQMGEIRGAGSKGIIEVSVEEGFGDKVSIQELFADLADYYSSDSAFLGVSISNYETYTTLPEKAEPEEQKFQIPGFKLLSAFLAGLGVFVLLKVKRK